MTDTPTICAGWAGVLGGAERLANHPASLYAEELLAQAGVLNWRWVDAPDELAGDVRIALVPHARSLSVGDAASIRRFVESGGRLLVLGRPGPLADLFAVTPQPPTRDGWLVPGEADDGTFAEVTPVPLHVFDIAHLMPAGNTPLDAPVNFSIGNHKVNWPASAHVRIGEGEALLISADLLGSVVRIQQGLAVHADGEPAPDGTAPIDDGILKCDDSMMLDWSRDRQKSGDGPCPIFAVPQCDLLRELLIAALTQLAGSAGMPLVTLDPWPRNLPAVGLISHDSDHHTPDGLDRQLATDAEADVKACWCTMAGTDDGELSEYTLEQLARIAATGHEIAFHYDAQSDHPAAAWGRDTFRAQLSRLRERMRAAGVGQAIYSNKNHYTRWEGRLDFFRWLEAEGIRTDQSRGPTKEGNLGWPFGTCHPWRVLDDEAAPPRLLDVLEVSFQTQDMGLEKYPFAFMAGYVDAAVARRGVVHLLFHPHHTHMDDVRANLAASVRHGRSRGVEWWTSRQIGRWQFARRGLRLESFAMADGRAELKLSAAEPLDGTVLRLTGPVDGGTDPTDLSGTCEVSIAGF